MRKILFLTIITIFISCIRHEDDSNDVCTMDCTQISGHILKADGTGVDNLELVFKYEHAQELSSYKRKIGAVRTNENGFYEMNVFLKDGELGNSGGYFILELNFEELEMKLADNFLKPSEFHSFLYNNENDSYFIGNIDSRDEIFEIDYNIPFKSNNLNISLNNFTPIQEGDAFLYNITVPYGFPEKHVRLIQEQRFAENIHNTYNCSSIIGENKITIIRCKNGINLDNINQIINVTDEDYQVEFQY